MCVRNVCDTYVLTRNRNKNSLRGAFLVMYLWHNKFYVRTLRCILAVWKPESLLASRFSSGTRSFVVAQSCFKRIVLSRRKAFALIIDLLKVVRELWLDLLTFRVGESSDLCNSLVVVLTTASGLTRPVLTLEVERAFLFPRPRVILFCPHQKYH